MRKSRIKIKGIVCFTSFHIDRKGENNGEWVINNLKKIANFVKKI